MNNTETKGETMQALQGIKMAPKTRRSVIGSARDIARCQPGDAQRGEYYRDLVGEIFSPGLGRDRRAAGRIADALVAECEAMLARGVDPLDTFQR